jgi:hypothetical protein
MLKQVLITLVLGLSLMFTTSTMAAYYLVSDPNEPATYYVMRLLNATETPDDDQKFEVSAQSDGSLHTDLINFPAGVNKLMVKAGNVFYESTEVAFEFDKDMPGIPSNVALVNIDGLAYLTAAPQEGISYYRVIVDTDEYMVDAESDGSLLYSLEGLEDGIHSIESYAINDWGESNPAPLGFTKQRPNAPENMNLIR